MSDYGVRFLCCSGGGLWFGGGLVRDGGVAVLGGLGRGGSFLSASGL